MKEYKLYSVCYKAVKEGGGNPFLDLWIKSFCLTSSVSFTSKIFLFQQILRILTELWPVIGDLCSCMYIHKDYPLKT